MVISESAGTYNARVTHACEQEKRAGDDECTSATSHPSLTIPARSNSRSIETLRHALQRERGSFSNVHGGTPIRQLFRGWVRGGSVTEGSRSRGCSNVKETKKGALRPFVCLAAVLLWPSVYVRNL